MAITGTGTRAETGTGGPQPGHPPTLVRRVVFSGLATAALALATWPAMAQQPAIRLFKVISPKDEIIIGLTEADIRDLGGGDVAALAKRLVAEGQITVWRYVVGRDASGNLRHAAQGKVALLRNDTVRIEPYAPALPVAPPP